MARHEPIPPVSLSPRSAPQRVSAARPARRIIVLCPLAVEHAAIARHLARAHAAGRFPAIDQLLVRLIGPGPDAARAATVRARQDGAALIVLAGFAGALHPHVPLPPNAAPVRTIRDYPRSPRTPIAAASPAAPPRPAPQTLPIVWHFAPDPASTLPQPGLSLLGSDAVAHTPADKARRHAETSADLIDTESHAFARALEPDPKHWGTAHRVAPPDRLVVRVVSDAAHESLPACASSWIDASGRTRTLRVLADLLRSPSLLPVLVRLARRASLASAALRTLVDSEISAWADATVLPPASRTPPITPLAFPDSVRALLLVGGSFDPPHLAHINLPLAARDTLAHAHNLPADSIHILFIPAARSPGKARSSVPDSVRLELLSAALRDAAAPGLSIWTDELDRAASSPLTASPSPSYTIHTLHRLLILLRATCPEVPSLFLLLGADQAAAFHTWRSPRDILALARPVVLPRPSDPAPPLPDRAREADPAPGSSFWTPAESAAWASSFLDLAPVPVSATLVRDALARADYATARSLLAPSVFDIIRDRALYASAPSPPDSPLPVSS